MRRRVIGRSQDDETQTTAVFLECEHKLLGTDVDVEMVRDDEGNWRQTEFADCPECAE